MSTIASRRGFLSGLGGVGAALVASGTPAATAGQARRALLLHTYIAGVERYCARGKLAELEPGHAILLRREPANSYDARAVAVLTVDDQMLGYVPRIDNKAIAALMDQGFDLSASVSSFKPGKRPEVGLSVSFRGPA